MNTLCFGWMRRALLNAALVALGTVVVSAQEPAQTPAQTPPQSAAQTPERRKGNVHRLARSCCAGPAMQGKTGQRRAQLMQRFICLIGYRNTIAAVSAAGDLFCRLLQPHKLK